METLFIADDESAIREGLKQIIDWESLGFTLCGEASNGKDALSQILALHPSLVLLDVKMPGLHGTEVIRLARESGFEGKCIILSGYADFQYAQEAIRSGVRFYLTKPIDEDELLEAVTQIREEITQAKAASSHPNNFQDGADSTFLPVLAEDDADIPLSTEDLCGYAERLCDALSSYNRRMLTDIMDELTHLLKDCSDTSPRVRLLLTDLFIQIKERMTHHYPSLTLPFYNNSDIIDLIHKSGSLSEIFTIISEQFETVMGALGNTAKDTILYDVLFYIDHHFIENIKLEGIASLFGYNSAYLGKIFTKSVGESFNSLVSINIGVVGIFYPPLPLKSQTQA